MGRGRVALLSAFFIFTLILIVIPSASALGEVSYFVESIVNGIKDIATPIFSALFGLYNSDEFLYTKILLFILFFVVIRTAVKAAPIFEGKHGIANIISLVISLFAVRYLSESDFVKGILLPYGTLGVAIAVLIPFIIFFYLVEKTGKSAGFRKGAWFIYMVIMFILWFNRRSEITREAGFIYLGVVIVCVILFFTDKSIQKYFDRRTDYQGLIMAIDLQINKLMGDYNLAVQNGKTDLAKKLLKEIKKLEDQKHDLK